MQEDVYSIQKALSEHYDTVSEVQRCPGKKGVNSCRLPAWWATSELDLISYPVGCIPDAFTFPFSPSPCLVNYSHTSSSSAEPWGLCTQLQYQVHLKSIWCPSDVPDVPLILCPSWRRLWGAGAQWLWDMCSLSSCVFSWAMGVLISDKALCSHCNINYSVKISQMEWAKSLTLFLCCKKPGGASASFSIASQESNSSLSLNCQSFVPGHRAT